MNTHFLTKAVLGAACLALASNATAQNLRGERTLYVMPHAGFSTYVGDQDAYPFDFGYWKDGTSELPVYAGLQIGYQFTPYVALGFGGAYGHYPTIFGDGTAEANHGKRFIGNAMFRFTAGAKMARFAPYVELGAAVNNGETKGLQDGDTRLAYGPLAGIGLDVSLTPKVSVLLGGNLGFYFPDENTDANDLTGADKFADFDLLGGFGVGVKYNFRPAFTPVMVMAIDGPSTLETNQTGTFTATTNDMSASKPVEYRWDFGDGSTAMGMTATHAYSRAGTYTVTFTASNSGSMDSKSMTVTVTNPPVPAGVVSLSSNPAAARVCLNQPVSFTSSSRGDAPVNASWNFGDGSTGTGMTPTHTYTRTGTFTVSLNVSNASGSDARTLPVTVVDCRTPAVTPPVVATCNLTELNSVFFERNGSTLTAAGREALSQNLEAIRSQPGCANTRVRTEGYAAPGERNAQGLSEDRARAVAQFYMDNGMMNVTSMGMGTVGEQTGKKDDTSQFRRVDSIPQR